MPVIIALFAAATVAMAAATFLPPPRAELAARLAKRETRWEAPPPPLQTLSEAVGSALLRLTPATWLVDAGRDLYWAQLAGKWQGWTPVSFWGLRLLAAVGAAVLAATLGFVPAWGRLALIGVGLFLPARRLHGDAEEARKALRRELPAAARAMALLVDTGLPVAEALEEVASGQGVLSRWLRTRVVGDPGRLFSRYTVDGRLSPGRLREEAEKAGEPSLRAFAVQLDLVAQRGTGIREAMHALAESTSTAYFAWMEREAEALDGRMTVPAFIFFMVPYLILAALPALVSAMQFLVTW